MKKSIGGKILKLFLRICSVKGDDEKIPKKSKNGEFNVEKWRQRIQKTCHDFDAMETTFNHSMHNGTINSLRSRREVYRSELDQMKSEIHKLRREKEKLQRGLENRQIENRETQRSRRVKRARAVQRGKDQERFLRYRCDSAYSTSTPTHSTKGCKKDGTMRDGTYQSNDSNVFYVFL